MFCCLELLCVMQIWIISLKFNSYFDIFKCKIVLFLSNYECPSASTVRGVSFLTITVYMVSSAGTYY